MHRHNRNQEGLFVSGAYVFVCVCMRFDAYMFFSLSFKDKAIRFVHSVAIYCYYFRPFFCFSLSVNDRWTRVNRVLLFWPIRENETDRWCLCVYVFVFVVHRTCSSRQTQERTFFFAPIVTAQIRTYADMHNTTRKWKRSE